MTHEEFDQIYDETGCDGDRDKMIEYLFEQRKRLIAALKKAGVEVTPH
jgi:hypothetical protein